MGFLSSALGSERAHMGQKLALESSARKLVIQKHGSVLELEGILDHGSISILLDIVDRNHSFTLDLKRIKEIDLYCMQRLIQMSVDYTFLIRNASFGLKYFWVNAGMDVGNFTDLPTSDSIDALWHF